MCIVQRLLNNSDTPCTLISIVGIIIINGYKRPTLIRVIRNIQTFIYEQQDVIGTYYDEQEE